MSSSGRTEQEIIETVRAALIYTGFLAMKAEDCGEDLASEIERQLQPAEKRLLERDADNTLRQFTNSVMASGIIDAVGKKIDEVLGQTRWTKWALVSSQAFGLVAVGGLVNYHSCIPGNAMWFLGFYSISVIVSIFIAIFRSR